VVGWERRLCQVVGWERRLCRVIGWERRLSLDIYRFRRQHPDPCSAHQFCLDSNDSSLIPFYHNRHPSQLHACQGAMNTTQLGSAKLAPSYHEAVLGRSGVKQRGNKLGCLVRRARKRGECEKTTEPAYCTSAKPVV
jgi:hypothetical protein